MKKVTENRNRLAERQQVIDTSVILRDFLQEKGSQLATYIDFCVKRDLVFLV